MEHDVGLYVDLTTGNLQESVAETVREGIKAGYINKGTDSAAITSAFKLAEAIENAQTARELYLMPHLLSILRELYCTPLTRLGPAKLKMENNKRGGKLSTLRGENQGAPRE